MKNHAYIALGSNIGDREQYLIDAIKKIHNYSNIKVVNISSIYETDPVGYTDQDEFLNMVISINTDLTAFQLLSVLQETEKQLNRKRDIRWGPRTLDLDILLFNYENIEAEQLIVPHPRMHERAFVLIPLFELNQDVKIPSIDEPISTIIDQLHDKEGVRIWKQKNGVDVFALLES
ncbi:2-amino-4-hydroxy-6-hydroxymethyldihydropteridine diphosphokinase [Metabacillus halosaccharovorans]|uniref:2-amino-4-hydroxy-6- hydroxymethyldihydropteridine diphosphokinase n=1 Tax=Metabacillus halosaccharovorans TaxID=930124 RepID=UPI001C1FF2A3|nr:2-amino-4-hydroxy-6-hydroxymethyldihydropteridine diphosphokinase [Metabacillus halosaccharovorans]MBU7594063.1 2-amino-4-hydroxy-6-hydroxymethyldihydropteridine diphosphokinase [Metabacillus halosaccharovorans]